MTLGEYRELRQKKIEELYTKPIATITIKGWWWKKYFKKYQHLKEFMEFVTNRELEKNHRRWDRVVRAGLMFGFPRNIENPWGIGIDDLEKEMDEAIKQYSEMYEK